MNITPIGNRVLVERLKTTDITTGGIYIPETAKEKANVALVLSVGPGRWQSLSVGTTDIFSRQELSIHPGDKILFGKYSGVDFEHNGKTLLFLREEEIFAILLDNVSVVR